ncbi:MAG: glucose-6-phosphate dehydrogenase assembly protein OpcA [Puniceicoccaceae bacterium]
MTTILEALPGILLPISEVNRQLGSMWQPGREGTGAPSEFRASQMNLILHFGIRTTPEDARARFEEAIYFSQRYPCRIIVLCPEETIASKRTLEGKLFAQCYIGQTPRTMCCCEALMLGYPPNEQGDLENQVSIWLESGLPTCHWFHRVPAERVRDHYLPFTHGMKRILYDSSVEGGGYTDIPWEDKGRVRDLAAARILPLRQSIGQYLSGFPPETLTDGVTGLRLRHGPALAGEARNLCAWMAGCLRAAGAKAGLSETLEPADAGGRTISGEWTTGGAGHHFSFEMDLASARGCLRAGFGSAGTEEWPFEAHLLGSRETLSEAVFF